MLMMLACVRSAPVRAPPVAPVVRTYTLTAADHLTSPARLSELLAQYFDVTLLLTATAQPGGTLRLDIASVEDGEQNLCAPTTTFDALPLDSDGGFAVEGQELALLTDDVAYRLTALSITGTLSPQALTAPLITGTLDTRPLKDALGSSDDGAVCQLLGKIIPCQSCPDDGAPLCWQIALTDVLAPLDGAPVQPRDREAICADPQCTCPP